jgi:hypothetical protein
MSLKPIGPTALPHRSVAALLVLALGAGCGRSPPSAGAGPSPDASSSSATVAPAAASSAAGASSAAPPASGPSFGELVRTLSEPDGPFLSDNIVSNETSYLQVASALAKSATSGGAYLGVGPEQNFTYIALARPKLAFIVDIRRQNLLLHLLYRAVFMEAATRSQFLTLLLGRPYDGATEPGPAASVAAVMAHAEKLPPDESLFAASHARLRERIERDLHLDASDRKTLEVTHRAFLRGQLDVRFELHEPSGRRYPSLRELLAAKDPEGTERGFLASEDAFRFVQTMEREGRIIPVVGDFAGDRAMPGIAALLTAQHLDVSTFYVSNVEQYLFAPNVWPRWSRNVAALPAQPASLFVRAYLDEGRHHPLQMPGHRTTTVLQRIADFEQHQQKKPYASFWSLATEPQPAAP